MVILKVSLVHYQNFVHCHAFEKYIYLQTKHKKHFKIKYKQTLRKWGKKSTTKTLNGLLYYKNLCPLSPCTVFYLLSLLFNGYVAELSNEYNQ